MNKNTNLQPITNKLYMRTEIIKEQGQQITLEVNGDIMVNATEMARQFGKTPKDWLRTSESEDYINAFSVRHKCLTADLVQVRQGGAPEKQGTWMSRKIALRFAQWLNPAFAVWVDEKLEELLVEGCTQLSEGEVKAMIVAGKIKLSVDEIRGLKGGSYTLKPVIHHYNVEQESYTEFSIGTKKFTVPTILADGIYWYKLAAFLKGCGLMQQDSDTAGFARSLPPALCRQFSPYGSSYKRHYLNSEGIRYFGFDTDKHHAAAITHPLHRRQCLSTADEQRLSDIVGKLKDIHDKSFLMHFFGY